VRASDLFGRHTQGAFIIPNRAFDSADHRTRFCLALKEKLARAKLTAAGA
jgi:hypothetical protein